jgi:hypothetical protein
MSQLITVLLVIFAILGGITLLGHGIWVVLAAILGGKPRREDKPTFCAFCRHGIAADDQRCDWCGKETSGLLVNELRDLEAVDRQLQRWKHSGRLEPATVEKMLVRVKNYREGLLHPPVRQERETASKSAASPAAVAPATPSPANQPAAVEPAIPITPRDAERPIIAQVVHPSTAKPQAAVSPIEERAVPKPPVEIRKPSPPVPPGKSWSEMISGFMEERNIRWGELIGGLLIVGPAIALVISFWEKLEQNPYLQVSIFVASCSAVFGVGLYAHHRWKLRSTSMGLLITATLLVPLVFLAMAAVWKNNTGFGTFAIDVISLGIFVGLMTLSGRVLVPAGRWMQTLGVMGSSAAVLVAARWVSAESADWWYVTAAFFSVACFTASTLCYMARVAVGKKPEIADLTGLVILLGAGAFAMFTALGILVERAGGITAALDRLSVPLAIAALTISIAGLVVRKSAEKYTDLSDWHFGGTVISLAGVILMLTALIWAWPHPLAIMVVAVLDCAALVAAAFIWRMPPLHAAAAGFCAIAYLTGFHCAFNHLPLLTADAKEMLRLLIGASSGTALTGLFAMFAAVSEILARRGLNRHGVMYLGGACAMAVLGLMLVTAHGLYSGGEDALLAAILYAIYGSGSIALTMRWRRIELNYVGIVLLAASPFWFLWSQPSTHDIHPMWAAALAIESIVMIATGSALRRLWRNSEEITLNSSSGGGFTLPLFHIGEAIAGAAFAVGAATAWSDRATIGVEHSFALVVAASCVAASLLILAWQYGSAERTVTASLAVLAGLFHTLVCNYTDLVNQPWLIAPLTHCTAATLTGLLLDQLGKRFLPESMARKIRRIYCKPLGDTAVFSSIVALFVLPMVSWMSTTSLAYCLYWLAALWLVLAWQHRNSVVFAAHQIMTAAATVVATSAWLKNQTWVEDYYRDLWHPFSLQAYGIALGVLCLIWVLARIALRRDETAKILFNPAWPAVDWLLRHILIACQLFVLAMFLLPSLGEELSTHFGVSEHFNQVQQQTYGYGAWIMAAVMASGLIASFWHRWKKAEVVSSVLLLTSLACLVASRFVNDLAVASALRWALAGSFIVVSSALWQRKRLLALCQRSHMQIELDSKGLGVAHGLLWAACIAPIILISILAAALQLNVVPPGGPAAEKFFHNIGAYTSYLAPLTVLALGMLGLAISEGLPVYAFFAGLAAALCAAQWYVIRVVFSTEPMHVFEVGNCIRLMQLLVIATGSWAAAWMALKQWAQRVQTNPQPDTPPVVLSGFRRNLARVGNSSFLAMQLALPAAGTMSLLAIPVARLVRLPVCLSAWMPHIADWPGWVGFFLSVLVIAWYFTQIRSGHILHVAGFMLLGLGVLVSCLVQRFCTDPHQAQWLSYHTLIACWTAACALMLGISALGKRLQWPLADAAIVSWVTAIGAMSVALDLMHAHADHDGAWWYISSICAVSACYGAIAIWRRLPAYVFISGLLLNAAGTIGWMAWCPSAFDSVVQVNVLCLAIGSIVWSLAHIASRYKGVPCLESDGKPLSYAHLAAVAALGLLTVLMILGTISDLAHIPELRVEIAQLTWIALGATALAIAVCIWDPTARFVLQGLYLSAFTALGMALVSERLDSYQWYWWAGLTASAFALLAAAVGRLLPRMKSAFAKLKIPVDPARWPAAWFAPAQAAVVAAAACLSVWISLDASFDSVSMPLGWSLFYGRIGGCLIGLLLFFAVSIMTSVASSVWREYWQYGAIAATVLLLSTIGWAQLDPARGTPTGDAPWLHSCVILMAAAIATLLCWGLGLRAAVPKESDWLVAVRKATPVLAATSLLLIIAVVAQERFLYDPSDILPISPWAAPWEIAVVAVVLIGLAAGCLTVALAPKWDPLRLTDSWLRAYVYAAEALIAIIAMHIRITVPWLFTSGILKQYWMLVVMAVAFAGAGLSAIFHKRKLPILSVPLERTAMALPLLPPIGSLFIKNYANAGNWFLGGSGPTFWLLMGLFYIIMALRKRSFGLGLLGIFTGNIGLWVLWQEYGLHFADRPQLWLIPPALAVLVAEHIDRRRLSEAQRAAIRYVALSVIYISSTTEFWREIGQSAILPVVTIVLCVLGVLAGILLKVRSFLYLGATCLLVVIVRMISYAAFERGHIWVFWTSCIILGAAIIALFAVFEKRRNDLLAGLERFKQWEK